MDDDLDKRLRAVVGIAGLLGVLPLFLGLFFATISGFQQPEWVLMLVSAICCVAAGVVVLNGSGWRAATVLFGACTLLALLSIGDPDLLLYLLVLYPAGLALLSAWLWHDTL